MRMPYIYEYKRSDILCQLGEDLVTLLDRPGNLNYLICYLANRLLERGMNYERLSRVLAEIECAKLEIYRRVAGPYEDYKAEQNGEVFTVAPIKET